MNSRPEHKNKGINTFIRFSSVALEMAIIIAAGTWGGSKLDEYFDTQKPIFTIVLSLIVVVAAIYLVVKQVLNANK